MVESPLPRITIIEPQNGPKIPNVSNNGPETPQN